MPEPSQKPYTYWIFCDESGDLSAGTDRYLIAAAVGTRSTGPLKQSVERAMQDAIGKRGKLKKKAKSKQKTKSKNNQDYDHAAKYPQIAKALLEQVAVAKIDDLALYVALLDKHKIWHRNMSNNLEDYKDIFYCKLFAYLIQQALSVKVDTTMQSLVILERRDNPKTYQDDLKSKIRIATSLDEKQIKILDKNDPEWGRQLKVADAIAWSTYRKYMGKKPEDKSYFKIISNKVKLELIVGIDNNGEIMLVENKVNKKE